MIDAVRDSDFHVTQARVSLPVRTGWRKHLKGTSPTLGHHRVWLMGDAIHAMLPARYVLLFGNGTKLSANLTWHHSGMGGNQSMHDAADVLDSLLKLRDLAAKGHTIQEIDIKNACSEYEDRMIPRAFFWVKKSGGQSVVVSILSMECFGI